MTRPAGKSAWGIVPFAIYGGFRLFILGFVMYASIQDVQLVEAGYYEKGLVYQERIDRLKRSRALESGLVIENLIAQRAIALAVPSAHPDQPVRGDIRLIRPSNSRLDRNYQLKVDSSGRQLLNTEGMARGLWPIEVDWAIGSAQYYNESRIVIP